MGPAEEAVLAPAASAAGARHEGRRGRLLRRYFLLSFVLVAGGLLTSGAWEIYLRSREIQDTMTRLQADAADSAAVRLGQVVQELHRAVTTATRSRDVTAAGLSDGYGFELDRLLLTAPAIAEAVAVDAHGMVRARATRVRPVLPEGQTDLRGSVAFQKALSGVPYLGTHFVRDSEPYLTIAVPIEHLAGEVVGVLIAQVSLIYVGENVVARMSDSDRGYTYVVNRAGELLAHPEINLVLQRRDVMRLDHVRAALGAAAGRTDAQATMTRNLDGERVFVSHAALDDLGWVVFVERPAGKVFRPLLASILRTAALMLVGLGVTLLATVLVARRIMRPLETLRHGVERIGSGDLSLRLRVETGDELELLADEFNRMTARLEEAYTGLEHKVTERTSELVALNRELDQANRLKSQFLANVSHELRTPMNAIIGFTRLVMRKTEGQIPPLQHANLQKVLISAEHLLNLINGLLDLSKIEAGHVEVTPARFEIDELVRTTVTTIEPMLRAGRVRLVTEIDPDLPPIQTDREKLKQILLNLLSNAAKFTDDGVITVSARRVGDALRLAVSDTGIGMPGEALHYIFEEFRQVDMSSTRRHGGTGLGLAIVRRLADLLGGSVAVESEMGKGSTFTVTIPLELGGAVAA